MKRILVADDEPVTLRLHQLMLKRAGHEASLHEDGDQALADALLNKPDLAILDYQLPGKTGLELVQAFRAEPDLCRVPIIIVTGFREMDLRDRLLEAGATDVVTKPFSSKLLKDRIDELLTIPA